MTVYYEKGDCLYMGKKELLRRYVIFAFGLIFNSFGVAFVTKASLGTSPISSIPYSLSLIITRLTMGNWTIFYSILLTLLQWAILKKNAKKAELVLQMIVSVAFGYLIDFSMFLLQSVQPQVYIVKIVLLLIGCVIIAFGAYLEVVGDVVMLPGYAFVRAITKVTKKEYGIVRVISDVSMAVVAAILCLVFLHRLIGVREGTIIAALVVGTFVKIFSARLKPLTAWLLADTE